ncbi:MAG: glycosyltransferase family 2 protein [Ignavibacteriaceae bacterium]
MKKEIELTILMPCLNEAETIGMCIERANNLLKNYNLNGEVIISDNGSNDNSVEIAKQMGVRVINCPVQGYGAALQYGIEQANGMFILMGDSDDSYHFDEAFPMISKLREGYDVCMGSRLKGKIMPHAMPKLHKYIGNPVLTFIGRILFNIKQSDFHCGLRAFKRESILNLNLLTTGMEWASEMIIKSNLANLKVTEIPITLYKDGRSRPPHLRSWRDGWRHLRFMLLHSPDWLFIIPGFIMLILGIIGEIILTQGMINIGEIKLDVHSLLVMSFIIIIGMQTISTGVFAKVYAQKIGILPTSENFMKILKVFSLERFLVIFLIVGVLGTIGILYTIFQWYRINFSELNYEVTMRQLIPSLTLFAVAILGIFNSFMLSLLFLKVKKAD